MTPTRCRLRSAKTPFVVVSSSRHHPHGLAYVLSNDLFRDAQQRQEEDGGAPQLLKQWLEEGYSAATGPGRISYAFGDLGRLDDHGDPVLDLLPNPRHPLVAWVEQQQQQQAALLM